MVHCSLFYAARQSASTAEMVLDKVLCAKSLAATKRSVKTFFVKHGVYDLGVPQGGNNFAG